MSVSTSSTLKSLTIFCLATTISPLQSSYIIQPLLSMSNRQFMISWKTRSTLLNIEQLVESGRPLYKSELKSQSIGMQERTKRICLLISSSSRKTIKAFYRRRLSSKDASYVILAYKFSLFQVCILQWRQFFLELYAAILYLLLKLNVESFGRHVKTF